MIQLRVESLTKMYPSVVANQDIDLDVLPGEIHAVLGENGAGKSTLMKMIYGVTMPTRGRIVWEETEVRIPSPAAARALGIGMVFQHFSLFESLTVAENTALFLGQGASLNQLSARIRDVSEHYGLPVNPDRHVHDLSVGERQRVEIIRCLLLRPKLLIMDEPTSVLSPAAVDRLFATLRTIRDEGCAILYISHKLDEIRNLCDRATVLRAGRVSAQCLPAHETPQSLARMMIGSDFTPPSRPQVHPGYIGLELNGLSADTSDPFGVSLQEIHLKVHLGEVVGIAGISGNGQGELLQAISGETRTPRADSVRMCGQDVGRSGVESRRGLGLCVVPEDRLGAGAVGDMSLAENTLLTAARSRKLVAAGLVDHDKARRFAAECIDAFRVKASGPDAAARSLSGGNLQKFIIAREVLQSPRVLVCAQPTWGVDVGAAAFIRQSLIDLARSGCAVLVISEELDELFEICDRIAVMAAGRLSPLRATGETSTEEIGVWMSGLWSADSGVTDAPA
jgi:ABC-type uncharacterized transport system ATPase subunit